MIRTRQQPILEVKNLTKRYGTHLAVDNVSFTLNSGEIVGFLGPNGAGKTTTTSMLLGLLEPTAGEIMVFGKSLAHCRNEIAGRMNFSASFSWLPGNLTVWENLYIFSLLYGVKSPREKIIQELSRVGLEGFTSKKSGTLSSGEQSRLCLAKALLNDPELLLLDEPTSSLDPQSARDVRNMIRAETDRRGMAVLWTSHNMYEVEAICDRALFLSRGKILLEGDPKTLPKAYGKENLEELFISVAKESLREHDI